MENERDIIEKDSSGFDSPDDESSSGKMSRRDFLKLSGTFALAMFLPKGVLQYGKSLELDSTSDDLSISAQSYIAPSFEEATRISEVLFRKGASPSNICGPLSVAIMSDWRLRKDMTFERGDKARLDGIAPMDMWLASPTGESTDPKLLSYAFPEKLFQSFRVNENIGQVDFDNIEGVGKLKSGDFLYLDGGSFTHFLTISRIGKDGEVYATTNYPTDKKGEFVIDEVMLWNPQTKDGFFRKFSTGIGFEKAYTGRSGFYLWRRKETGELAVDGEEERIFRDKMAKKLLKQQGGDWNILISDLRRGKIFEWRDGMGYHPASTIKVPIAVITMQKILEEYSEEISSKGLVEVLKTRGFDGRSFDQLLTSMLVVSEEIATEKCISYVQQGKDIKDEFVRIGLDDTSYLPRKSSQRDLYKCWKGIFEDKYFKQDANAYLKNLLAEYTVNDDNFLGVVRKDLENVVQWNKRGAVYSGSLNTTQDTGILKINGDYFYIGIAGSSKQGKEISDIEAKEFIEGICRDFVSYIRIKGMKSKSQMI